MMRKGKQLSTSTHLVHKNISTEDAVQFLEDYRLLLDPENQEPMKAISLRVPPSLLRAFKYKAKMQGKPYQVLIKELMLDYLQKT